MYIKTSQEFRLSDKVCCMYWCFFYRKEKRSSSTRIKAKKTYWQKKLFKKFKWCTFFGPIKFGPIFVNQKRFFQF